MKPTRSQWNKREMHNEITIISYEEIKCGGKSSQTIEFNFVSNPNPTVRAVSQLLVCVLPALPFHADGAFVSMRAYAVLLSTDPELRQVSTSSKFSWRFTIQVFQQARHPCQVARASRLSLLIPMIFWNQCGCYSSFSDPELRQVSTAAKFIVE